MEVTSDDRPWYRQFWPWFIILLPCAAVAASIATLIIAMANAPDMVPGASPEHIEIRP